MRAPQAVPPDQSHDTNCHSQSTSFQVSTPVSHSQAPWNNLSFHTHTLRKKSCQPVLPVWFSATDIYACYPSVKFLVEVRSEFDYSFGLSAWLPCDFQNTSLAGIQISASYLILTHITEPVLKLLHDLIFLTLLPVNIERKSVKTVQKLINKLLLSSS